MAQSTVHDFLALLLIYQKVRELNSSCSADASEDGVCSSSTWWPSSFGMHRGILAKTGRNLGQGRTTDF